MDYFSGSRSLSLFENEYLSKILGFCYQKIGSSEDAEDLAQDIAVEVLKSIRKGKSIGNLNAFVWSVANHTFCKWLRAKKHGSTAYLTELFASDENTEDAYVLREQENLLHREIALLSENYRKSIVLYYFDSKSCDETARFLGRSTGTVKWWLHDARRIMKEGMNMMREYGEKSYRPGNLFVSCQGNPGADNEPISCAKRKSAQNILLAAYRTPMSIGNLCVELGISAPYVEDEVKYLCRNQLMREMAAGQYQTDFVILPGQNVKIADKIYEACFPAYYNALIAFLTEHKSLLLSGPFNTADFDWNRLLWVYLHIFTDGMACKFKHDVCKMVTYADIPDRPNGGKWIALGYDNGAFFESKPEWKEYQPFDGPVHKTGQEYAQGFFHYWSGLDSNVFSIFRTVCLLFVARSSKRNYLYSTLMKSRNTGSALPYRNGFS